MEAVLKLEDLAAYNEDRSKSASKKAEQGKKQAADDTKAKIRRIFARDVKVKASLRTK